MNSERLSKIILGPIIAEKSSRLADKYNQVALKVLPNANKLEIKKAVETLFNAQVQSVTTCNVKGKVKRTGRTLGKRSDWKKAYVTLAEGTDLDFNGPE